MAKKKEKRETLIRQVLKDAPSYEKLEAYIQKLQKHLIDIPEEYRDKAFVEFESEFDTCSVFMYIKYYRPETDEEKKNRETTEEIIKERQRDRDLELLKNLQEKYGKEY